MINSRLLDKLLEDRANIVLDRIELGKEGRAFLSDNLNIWFDSHEKYKQIKGKEKELYLRIVRADEYKTLNRHNNWSWEPNFKQEVANYQIPLIDNAINIKPGDIEWPDGKKFALCITHDMDILHYCQLKQKLRCLKYNLGAPLRRRLIFLLSILKHGMLAFGSKPAFPIDIWMKAENRYGFRSSMFFFSGPPPEPHYLDFLYHLTDEAFYDGKRRKLKEVLREIASAGWDVGLHGSIHSALNTVLLKEERERLSEAAQVDVITGRQHYLIYDIRITPLVHEKAGLLIDSSLGSNILPFSYRCGTALPHKMFDAVENRTMNLIQVPMIVHDVPLINMTKRNIRDASDIIFKLLEETAKRGSALTILFHNNCFEDDVKYLVFEKVLQKAHELGAWGCSVRDIYNWLYRRKIV